MMCSASAGKRARFLSSMESRRWGKVRGMDVAMAMTAARIGAWGLTFSSAPTPSTGNHVTVPSSGVRSIGTLFGGGIGAATGRRANGCGPLSPQAAAHVAQGLKHPCRQSAFTLVSLLVHKCAVFLSLRLPKRQFEQVKALAKVNPRVMQSVTEMCQVSAYGARTAYGMRCTARVSRARTSLRVTTTIPGKSLRVCCTDAGSGISLECTCECGVSNACPVRMTSVLAPQLRPCAGRQSHTLLMLIAAL